MIKQEIKEWYKNYERGYIDNNEFIAIERYLKGETPSCSTFIDEITRSLGYGQLGSIGLFEYELPIIFRKEMNIDGGTITWDDYFKYCKIRDREKKLKRIINI